MPLQVFFHSLHTVRLPSLLGATLAAKNLDLEMNSSEDHIRIVLGAEYDDNLITTLGDVLREFSATLKNKSYGVAGSQEVERWEIVIEDKHIEVVSETYEGLTIAGSKRVVGRIVTRVLERMSE